MGRAGSARGPRRRLPRRGDLTSLVRPTCAACATRLQILPLIPELHDFAGRYLNGGAFLVAVIDGDVAGCVGVTPGSDGTCEMNRLWIRPGARRAGLGRALCEESMAAARDLGFQRMALDVVPERTNAIALYRSLGFVETAPAHDYPFAMVFLARDI